MTNVTAAMVKNLRDMTGAGMMDCKSALSDTGGDFDAAVDWLRKKGLSQAAKKAGRVAAEGLIGISSAGNAAALVEVNAETDFVAKNDQFKKFVRKAADLALEESGDLARLLKRDMTNGASVEQTLTQLISTIGENLSVRRTAALAVSPGVVASYVHNAASPELGKIGVLVALKSSADEGRLASLGRQLAMHIAAAAPLALTIEHLPKETVDHERAIHSGAARQSGKPDNVIEKMVEGRMRKFYEEHVLLKQTFVIDGETQVAKVIEKAAAELGATIEIEGYVRFQVGEGIERTDGDFADEVRRLSE